MRRMIGVSTRRNLIDRMYRWDNSLRDGLRIYLLPGDFIYNVWKYKDIPLILGVAGEISAKAVGYGIPAALAWNLLHL